MRKRKKLLLLVPGAAAAVLVTMAVGFAAASSQPKWYIGGSELKESETLGGVAEPSALKADGVTTECQHSYYVAEIFNSGGIGKGSLTSLPVFNCSAAGHNCTLNKVEPTNLPWAMHDEFVGTKPYVVIEGVDIEVSYSGFGCPLLGTHQVTGSIGGALEAGSQTTVFNAGTASATGTSLKALGFVPVELTGTYDVEMVGPEKKAQLIEAK